MDEFLSEKEQLERIRDWWREYGWYVLGGVVLGALGLLGLNQYQSYQQGRTEAASVLYDELSVAVLDRAEVRAAELLAELRAEFPGSPYADQAGLLMASLNLDLEKTEEAVTELRRVLAETSDDELALVVRQRLARVLLHLERYAEALTVIDGINAGRFAGRYSELRGDIYLAQGDPARARAAYVEAFNAEHVDVLDRNMLQMKIDDLPVAANGVTTESATPGTEPAEGGA
ncbi:MAG TPA: tetratricopeptide repeat protein [Gammaproteobacteria bacterium]|nr:tetratricopeptide repeat protein [Gammaproteobacteria bacterium]